MSPSTSATCSVPSTEFRYPNARHRPREFGSFVSTILLDHPLTVPPVLDELRDRDEREAAGVAELAQAGQPGHGAVIVDDLGEHAGRVEASEPGEVDGSLGVPGTAQHPALRITQREDVSRADQLVGFGGGIHQRPDGPGPVGGGNPGRDAVASVHADRERGAHTLLVLACHQR